MTGHHPMVLAHAFGERYEVPLPQWLFAVGGAAVVALSFLLVARRKAVPAPEVAQPDDAVPASAFRLVRGLLSIVVTAGVAFVGLTGSQETAENIAPLFFWVIVWIAVPLSCGLLGDWTRSVNPFANLARLGDNERVRRVLLARSKPLPWSQALGWWPALGLFILLVLGELVFNVRATTPAFVAGILLVYGTASLLMGLLFGPGWLARGEVFSALFNTWGRLGYFRFGAPGRRRFAGGLDVPFERSASRVVFVLLLLVSINFDGLLSTPRWASYERSTLGTNLTGVHLLRTGSLLALVLLVLAVFAAFATSSARLGGQVDRPLEALAWLLPSLVPIAFGYLIAHYLQYLVINLQYLYPLSTKPGGPLPETFAVDQRVLPNSFYWYVSVVVIIAVHVVAVVLARRQLGGRAFTEKAALRSEYPWLVAMVAYTAFSLLLIAQDLTKETGSATTVAMDNRR